jgi:cathepsin A (carboxypeptidase C)
MLTIFAVRSNTFLSRALLTLSLDVLGNHAWTEALEWPGQKAFNMAEMKDLKANGKKTGTVKNSGNFTFMNIFGAGHMVPMDQPESSIDFLNRWLGGEWF